jgi:cytosine/adenosine deaminase-related metal-dependent hydrolase
MNKKLIIPGQIISADNYDTIYTGEALEITGEKITDIRRFSDDEIRRFKGEVLRSENLTLIPGFIQTHIHLCQTLFRGLAEDLSLIDWLQKKIFPFENAHNENSLKMSIRLGINELLKGGTTTILDMGTLHHQEAIFGELIYSGLRAVAGKCIMDMNTLFPEFKGSTDEELKNSYDLAKEFHQEENGRIKYGFAPRFVLSCSDKLLTETHEMMQDFDGSLFHTHSSENNYELNLVREKYKMDNIEYYHHLNLTGDHSVFAHCVYVNENEINILKNTGTRVAHCPSSNLKLGSGIADIPRFLKDGISVSIGADGAPCNNTLNIFNEMRLASLIQKPRYGAEVMDAKTVFRMATIEGARALHLNETGSIEKGKKADIVLFDFEDAAVSLLSKGEDVYSIIVYSAGPHNIHSVMVNGEWKIKEKENLVYDEKELICEGRKELKQLLERVKH